ncbi:Alpha-N-acetylgalactosamine-specific lectin [Holothuria leucospilota]|uniref:Alpha-N-acetylgalactosamine-specific lectin n=1 Tax=Holothuria leucospilota TaxID=206669 RepID=A0A9Q1CN30_HOLLE|nr:Alpha-N-acetylgalactosamine-specific lectin [Holothuria leucospilota]
MVFSCHSEDTMKVYIVLSLLLVMAFHTASPYVHCPKFCREGWFSFRDTASCYRFVGSPKRNYRSANQQCRAMYPTASLASITSANENDFLTHMWISLRRSGDWDDKFWIGYDDIGREGRWTWKDNSKRIYTRWSPGRPNGGRGENCGEIWNQQNGLGNWNDEDCNRSQAFLCKYTP